MKSLTKKQVRKGEKKHSGTKTLPHVAKLYKTLFAT
jgi:hypothetical protein